MPRHRDEITVDIGDPVYVHVEAEDGWCEGNDNDNDNDIMIMII